MMSSLLCHVLSAQTHFLKAIHNVRKKHVSIWNCGFLWLKFTSYFVVNSYWLLNVILNRPASGNVRLYCIKNVLLIRKLDSNGFPVLVQMQTVLFSVSACAQGIQFIKLVFLHSEIIVKLNTLVKINQLFAIRFYQRHESHREKLIYKNFLNFR